MTKPERAPDDSGAGPEPVRSSPDDSGAGPDRPGLFRRRSGAVPADPASAPDQPGARGFLRSRVAGCLAARGVPGTPGARVRRSAELGFVAAALVVAGALLDGYVTVLVRQRPMRHVALAAVLGEVEFLVLTGAMPLMVASLGAVMQWRMPWQGLPLRRKAALMAWFVTLMSMGLSLWMWLGAVASPDMT